MVQRTDSPALFPDFHNKSFSQMCSYAHNELIQYPFWKEHIFKRIFSSLISKYNNDREMKYVGLTVEF